MANQEQIIEAIKEMSVLELNDLVKAIEEEFGVTAPVAAVVRVAETRRKTEFDVELTSPDLQKSKLLKQLKKQLV